MVKLVFALLLISSTASAQALPTLICNSLKTERAKYPADLTPLCNASNKPECPLGFMLNAVAWKYHIDGYGMGKKETGYYVYSPAGPVASDLLQTSQWVWDVFIAAESQARVNCGNAIGAPSRPFVAPVDTSTPPDPNPCEELEKENAALKVQNNNLKVELDQCKTRLENATCTCSATFLGFIKVPCTCKVVK